MDKKVDGKRLARLKLLKKVGIFGLSASAIAIIVIAIFSFFPTGGGNFSIRFDDPGKAPNITMSEDAESKESGVYFLGQPLNKVLPTSCEDVYKYVSELKVKEVGGSQNLKNKANDGSEIDEALVHSVFLKVDGEADETLKVTLNLDGYSLPKNNTVGPLEYLRVLTYVSEISEDKQSESNVKTTVYGATNIQNSPTVLGNDDFREAVSTYKKSMAEDGRTARTSSYALNGQEYCEPFVSSNVGEQLVKQELNLQKGKTYRYTFVSYFEGYDPDGYGKAPLETYLLMSLHFGK